MQLRRSSKYSIVSVGHHDPVTARARAVIVMVITLTLAVQALLVDVRENGLVIVMTGLRLVVVKVAA